MNNLSECYYAKFKYLIFIDINYEIHLIYDNKKYTINLMDSDPDLIEYEDEEKKIQIFRDFSVGSNDLCTLIKKFINNLLLYCEGFSYNYYDKLRTWEFYKKQVDDFNDKYDIPAFEKNNKIVKVEDLIIGNTFYVSCDGNSTKEVKFTRLNGYYEFESFNHSKYFKNIKEIYFTKEDCLLGLFKKHLKLYESYLKDITFCVTIFNNIPKYTIALKNKHKDLKYGNI